MKNRPFRITAMLIIIFAYQLFITSSFAQAPEKMSFQSVIRNASGILLKNLPVGIRISILQTSSTGTAVYIETHTKTTNVNGLVSLEIGIGTPVTGTFAAIDWGAGPYFIKTETDPLGGTAYTITGTSQLMSVPYALFAKNAGSSSDVVKLTSNQTIAGDKTFSNKILVTQQGIGTSTPAANAALEISSTTQGLLPPRMSQAQRDLISASEGLIVYNTVTQKINYYDGIEWKNFDGTSAQVITIPVLTTTSMSAVAPPTATSGGDISSNGGALVTARGVCWGTSSSPTIALSTKTSDGTAIGAFPSSLTGLTTGITYYLRAYATNSAGTAYGNEISFMSATIPVLTTTAISAIASSAAASGGNISSDGGVAVTARGVCWSTSANPTIASSKTTDGTGTGAFTSTITGLAGGTTYYVKAYATSSAGTAYGSQTNFNTLASSIASLTTTAASSITITTASSGGVIANDGGTAVTVRGVCWSTSAGPTTANSKTTDGAGTGTFISSITGLYAGTSYNVRAYATNSAGTAYGNEISLTTSPAVLPTLTTNSTSSILSTTATSGGNISSDGGSPVTFRGVCWGTATNPTAGANPKTIDGTGTGSFTSSMTGLTGATDYYARAYATTTLGTAYGNQITFTTAVNIGQSFRGGIVAYILVSGDPGYIAGQTHGLIAAPTDQSTSIIWGPYSTTGATGTAIGTGNLNTNKIVTTNGAGSYAAKLCYDLVSGGYDDWYLPSIDELNKLYINKSAIGGFSTGSYWSSSETSSTKAWRYIFSGVGMVNDDKFYYSYYVRAIRAF